MKKSIVATTLALVALISFYSCEKEKQEVTIIEQSLEKTIKVNESATFTLPVNESDDAYKITTDAAHAYVSKLSDDLSGNAVYTYTPEKDYVGNDLIVVSTVEEKQHGNKGNKGHHKGGSKGGHCHGDDKGEQQMKVTIRINILKEEVTTPAASSAINAN
ncbi:MAG: hypothetical protein IPP32_09345 [Bacteroidetes bacterium]|nr:hypothetical protein [Bacteroidota bacterium]